MLFYTLNLAPETSYIDIINCIAACATAVFTLGAVIGAGAFAFKQNKIASRGQEIDLELRYFTHYQKLSDLLYLFGADFDATDVEINGKKMQSFVFSSDQYDQYYLKQFNIDNLKKLQLLKNEAVLCFSQNIIKLNQDIFEKANAIFIKQVFAINYDNKAKTQYFHNGNTGVLEDTFRTHSSNPIPLKTELSWTYSSFKNEYLNHQGMLKIKEIYASHTKKIAETN